LLAACSSGHRADIDGVLVVDEEVTLERGAHTDAARLEFPVDEDATFVALVEEDGSNVKLRMTDESAQGTAAEVIEVDTNMNGAGVELALRDAPRGAQLTIALESAQDFEQPRNVKLKIFRYAAETVSDAKVQVRLTAIRAWTAATNTQRRGKSQQRDCIADIDRALTYFESRDGDPALAAWGRVVRARLNYRGMTDIKSALLDVRRAARGFADLGAARNAGRARLLEVALLLEIVLDRNARDPNAEEAAREAKALLVSLSADKSLSATERAQATNHLGVLAFNLYDRPEARAKWQSVVPMYEAIGNRWGRIQSLQNLAVLAAEEGDYQAARLYFDRVLASFDQIGSVEQRATLLFNAAGVNLNAGYTDQGIELLLRALELTREHNLRQHEARIMYGLGRAYSARGDIFQATTFHAAALKLRRTIDDPSGLLTSLIASGILARDAGNFAEGLALHKEADSLATTAEKRIYTQEELAIDYAAASDFKRAIAICREILAMPGVDPKYYWLHEVRLTLAESLLTQPDPTPEAVSEAATLTKTALDAAISREATTSELASRRLLAQTYVARGGLQEARDEYRRAIALIFKYGSNIGNPEFRVATAAQEPRIFGGYLDLLMRDAVARGPNKLLPLSAAEEEALRTLEWARAVNFDSTRVSRLDAATQVRVDQLLTEMAGKRIRVAALLERSDDVTRQLEILQLDISQLRAQVDRLRAATVRGTNAARNAPLVDAPWPEVGKGTTQLSYFLEGDHAYLWVRDASGIRATALAASPAGIARDVAALDAAIRSRTLRKIDATLARLSSVLIPPDAISPSSTTIRVVADGRIDGIPFAGLSLPRNAGRLADRRSLTMITSLFERGEPPGADQSRSLDLVALASDSRGSGGSPEAAVFSTLHNTNSEVRAIAALFQSHDPRSETKLLLGADGSASNLRNYWKAGVDVIHFATHGLSDPRQPLTSLLLLPAKDAAGNAAYLTAGQVMEWRGDIDLVFLGACDTAVGPVRFAEGMSGMQGAFLRAGARGVIATLWPVEDVYASQFAADFYRRYTQGVPAAQSLSETQRAWIQPSQGVRESEQGYRRMTAWAHVLYAP
jgi:CHAT domain-containing protein/Tfp pilus assembly protein PilF